MNDISAYESTRIMFLLRSDLYVGTTCAKEHLCNEFLRTVIEELLMCAGAIVSLAFLTLMSTIFMLRVLVKQQDSTE